LRNVAEIVQILESVKNNLAVDLKAYQAKVWFIFDDHDVKNILATSELILISGLTKR